MRAKAIFYKLARARVCIELNWIELNWIELNWIELNWIELNWIELNWIELNWIELNWIELNWIELNWIGLDWIGLNWIELNWIELSWIVDIAYWNIVNCRSASKKLLTTKRPDWTQTRIKTKPQIHRMCTPAGFNRRFSPAALKRCGHKWSTARVDTSTLHENVYNYFNYIILSYISKSWVNKLKGAQLTIHYTQTRMHIYAVYASR